MSKTIGIYVSSDQHLDKLIKLCRAAQKKDVAVKVFFTHIGTRLSTDARVRQLEELATTALCKVGFESHELKKEDAQIDEKKFLSQSWHAEMIHACDRYLAF